MVAILSATAKLLLSALIFLSARKSCNWPSPLVSNGNGNGSSGSINSSHLRFTTCKNIPTKAGEVDGARSAHSPSDDFEDGIRTDAAAHRLGKVLTCGSESLLLSTLCLRQRLQTGNRTTRTKEGNEESRRRGRRGMLLAAQQQSTIAYVMIIMIITANASGKRPGSPRLRRIYIWLLPSLPSLPSSPWSSQTPRFRLNGRHNCNKHLQHD